MIAGILMLLLVFVLVWVGVYQAHKKLPDGLSFEGAEYPSSDCEFLRDLTWVDTDGTRHLDQQIFDSILGMIRQAKKLILMDMFLFNDFAGTVSAGERRLALEVTEALLARKREVPGIRTILITDPVNTVYGGLVNPYFTRLRNAGIIIIISDLDRLRDSNFLYSPLWRLFLRPFGANAARGELLPNPFGLGRVSIRSYLWLFNFKANHRKLLVTDQGECYAALVTSANPHDSSSSHGNVAIKFSGPAVLDVVAVERSVPGVPQGVLPDWFGASASSSPAAVTVQILSEGRIKRAVLRELRAAGEGDLVALVMFYLADRQIIRALREARLRGAKLRVVLDPNKDAFGRIKNGIPNRQSAARLVAGGVKVRWGSTHGEQLHSKMLLIERACGSGLLFLGSANFTRRNLDDYNLELDVAVRGSSQGDLFVAARRYVDQLWYNQGQRLCSLNYAHYADNSFLRRVIWRWLEASGMGTF